MESSQTRFDHQRLRQYASSLLASAGLPAPRADVVADVFVEGDLMGYRTHGLQRVSSNMEWLLRGETNAKGDVKPIATSPVCETWDADYLPGPWVVRSAVSRACEMAQAHGTGTIAISRVQHIACLAAYLMQATDQGMLVMIMTSTPASSTVSAHGGTSRIFSCNPLAVGIPSLDRPILIDTSASMSAMGPLSRSFREGRRLNGEYIVLPDGTTSADPASYYEGGGAIMPAGGIDQGYKGFALTIVIEALSAALAGYGRATPASADDGEANVVFVQAIDPAFFGGTEKFRKETSWLGDICRASSVAPGTAPVRMPGDRALALREEQMREGVALVPSVLADLRDWGHRMGIDPL